MVSVRALIQISRVDRMAGTMILFWPFAWSLTMSARQAKLPLVNYLEALFIGFIGACLLHSTFTCGGCVWDDIVDMDFDAQVERTKNRPLPGGRITVPEASAFLAVHIVLLFALSHGLDHVSQTLAFLTIVPFTGLYPYMKRITNLPQVWLGITLHIPVMLASQVMLGHISTASIYLFLGCSMWTLWYDAIYSCPDKKDDAKAGVKSITFLLGDHIKTGLTVFAGCLVAAWLACGILNQSGLIYYLVTVIGGASLLAHRTYGTDLDNDLACHKTFESSAWTIGPAVFGGFLLDYLVSH